MEDKNDRGHPGIELPGSSDRQGLEGLQQIVDTDAVLEVK